MRYWLFYQNVHFKSRLLRWKTRFSACGTFAPPPLWNMLIYGNAININQKQKVRFNDHFMFQGKKISFPAAAAFTITANAGAFR